MDAFFMDQLAKSIKIDPKDKLPSLAPKDIKKTLNANKDKLTIILFFGSFSSMSNLYHSILSPITKENRMAVAYCVDISKDQSIIAEYQLKHPITTITFKNCKESQRFPGLLNSEVIAQIKDNIPKDPFGGSSHKITQNDQSNFDYEEYLKSVRRPKPENPPPKPKITKIENKPTQKPAPPPQTQPEEPPEAMPVIDPFTDYYSDLKRMLLDISYTDDEIFNAFLAGCGELNECGDFIESSRAGQTCKQKFTHEGISVEGFSEQQRQIYESNIGVLDRLEMIYVIAYTGTSDEDELFEFVTQAEDHQPLPRQNQGKTGTSSTTTANSQATSNSTTSNSATSNSATSNSATSNSATSNSATSNSATSNSATSNSANSQATKCPVTGAAVASGISGAGMQKSSEGASAMKAKPVLKKVTMRFNLPNHSNVQYEFEPTDTFEIVERKLKDEGNIGEDDVVEFVVMPYQRIPRQDFAMTLCEKKISGRVMMSIIVLPPQPKQKDDEE